MQFKKTQGTYLRNETDSHTHRQQTVITKMEGTERTEWEDWCLADVQLLYME